MTDTTTTTNHCAKCNTKLEGEACYGVWYQTLTFYMDPVDNTRRHTTRHCCHACLSDVMTEGNTVYEQAIDDHPSVMST